MQQSKRSSHHHFVQAMVYLCKVCRSKDDFHTGFPMVQFQASSVFGIQRINGVRAFWLIPKIDAIVLLELSELCFIVGSRFF